MAVLATMDEDKTRQAKTIRDTTIQDNARQDKTK